MTLRIANAPVSYGAFEETVGVLPNVPGPDELLAAIAAAGYAGTELGPLGYLGDGDELRARLDRHGLALTGAFVAARARRAGPRRPRADARPARGRRRDRRPARPGGRRLAGAARERSDASRRPSLVAAARRTAVMRAAELARSRGFEPTFHHHAGTFVETPHEIDALLAATDVGLLLDTGHLLVGGGDPVEALARWGVAHRLRAREGRPRRRPPAGARRRRGHGRGVAARASSASSARGDVDLHGFFARLDRLGYEGWVVVEQDRIPREGEPLSEAADAQARNRRWLADQLGL